MIVFRALTHIVFAFNVALFLRIPWVHFPLIGFGAILPDIDCEFSPVGREISLGRLLGRHRTFTHSIFACFLAVAASPVLAFGYMAHVALDLLNPTGCQLFWPLNKWVKFPVFRSGGFGETAIRWGMIAVFFYSLSL